MLTYKVGDHIVFAGHGVCQVKRVERKTVGGKAKDFYVMNVLESDMTLMAPVDNAPQIRPIASPETANRLIEFVQSGKVEVLQTTWNRRYREYDELLKTGHIDNIAQVFKLLITQRVTIDLSFGERKMLDRAMNLLITELSLSLNKPREEIQTLILTPIG